MSEAEQRPAFIGVDWEPVHSVPGCLMTKAVCWTLFKDLLASDK